MREWETPWQRVGRDSDGAWGDGPAFPPPDRQVLAGVRWGRHDCLFTPAYWAAQAWYHAPELEAAPIRLGRTLAEEVVACLLGGHGAPAETGLAAFDAVRRAGLLDGGSVSAKQVEAVLTQPLLIRGRSVRYRFARMRSAYVAGALAALSRGEVAQTSHRDFRDGLTRIRGIGPKSASWITRNWLYSDQVAVLDVHVFRAGLIMGLFTRRLRIERDYAALERRFLDLAAAIQVRASRLDALIWRQMRSAGPIGIRATDKALKPFDSPNIL
jgi:thermostable 8-oxoguanine DNA glycosylase